MAEQHFCTVCFCSVESHNEDCEWGCRHYPPLCCQGCSCRSNEDAHTEARRLIVKKEALYKTAEATISCASVKAGDIVSVKYHHTSNGVNWYEIAATQHGELDTPVYYPSHHLTHFVL